MVELIPLPFSELLPRMLREVDEAGSVFGLPLSKAFTGDAERDLSVSLHGRAAGCSLGPAAGPHTQMAQNIVLAWVAGCRVFELKTVQINDRLAIPRPCIDVQTIGYNVEWSQELRLAQSLEEYVKAAMLIEVLLATGRIVEQPSFAPRVYDMSVGYDLEGITSEPVNAFIDGVMDCRPSVDELRAQIPDAHRELRELDYPSSLSGTLTLSTFHGCPPDQIEAITRHLMEAKGLDCSVKLNPLLLGPERMHELLHEKLGYTDVVVPDEAFEEDAAWEQATGIVNRLADRAAELGRGLGVKLTNTLVVENKRAFFDAEEKRMYLSGQPLHVLAMNLVRDLRRQFGDRVPISFSAGLDKLNYPDAVAMGLVPATVCTDLLRPGGYGRVGGYLKNLVTAMDALGATTIDAFILRSAAAAGSGAEAADSNAGDDVAAAKLANTERIVPTLAEDPRYARAKTDKPPRKVGSTLELFDCLNCDKCVPVCPNAANFAYELPPGELPRLEATLSNGEIVVSQTGSVTVEKQHQLANFADFCNECGNCDVFCPEDGGPYVLKPRVFGRVADLSENPDHDGLALEQLDGGTRLHGRLAGADYVLELRDGRASFSGPGFALNFADAENPLAATGEVSGTVDLSWYPVMRRLQAGLWERDAASAPPFARA